MSATRRAIALAERYGTRLHIAHVSTAEELDLIAQAAKHITAEVCPTYLLFCRDDYARLGTRIKCNPAVKTAADRDALRRGLADRRIYTIGTDHTGQRHCNNMRTCPRNRGYSQNSMFIIYYAF